jgi:PTH1 family peptidyl-tRNA hydrolase
LSSYLISGLGNPGPEYAGHRHNVGFWCIDRLAQRHGIRLNSTRLAWTGEGRIEERDVLLVKPRTFVNGSGRAIAPLLKQPELSLENLIVVYDELDLPEGRVRLRRRGSAGGHNGLKSIIAAVGGGDFGRVRIGIGRPYLNGVPTWDPEVVMRYVLAPPPAAGRAVLDAAVDRACDAIEAVLRDGWERVDEAPLTQPSSPRCGGSPVRQSFTRCELAY